MSRTNLVYCLTILLVAITSNSVGADKSQETITVGIVHSEKFPTASMMKSSYEMALKRINDDGGIKGRPVKLVYADDGGDGKSGEKAVKKLVKTSTPAMLVGGYASSNTITTARVADKLDIPFLITTASDDRITQRKWKNVFRINPPAQEYAKGVEDLLLKKMRPSSMAIIYENSPYGTGAAMRMMWFCRENNIEIRKIIPYHRERANAAYFEGLLRPLINSPPEIIYMVSYFADGVELVNKIKALKLDSLLIGGAGGFTDEKFISTAGDAADRLLTATLWAPQAAYPGSKEYFDNYHKKHSVHPDYHGAEAYAALFVAADVLKRSDSMQAKDIRNAMNSTDILTPFGPVTFKSYGKFERQNRLPTMVLQVIDSKFEVVWPEDIATSEVRLPHSQTGSGNE